ncbi:DNA recombination/repair protein RecA/RadB, ATP-binding domain containing protein [Rhodotorula toruloides]|uniref:DNA recombination/repair protein RecA/RadB, ATP-binding domain containing protein n=1 Tax=Rhodotorula toruloides TaxID=5286 RepID=A0A511KHW4_RHOTO|nr:DNA recombination/repair protein RecA/RadB, ATP-binding domain containing protein [Rhodotorula toruloides]
MSATPLATLLPTLLPEEDLSLALEVLAHHRIVQDVDLLFSPPLPPHPSLLPEQLDRLRSLVATRLSAASTSGVYLLQQSRNRKGEQPQRFSSTLDDFDDDLDGGFDVGEVVEITGQRRSGRTAFALYILLFHLFIHRDKRAAWLDTTSTFDPYRCLAILRDNLIPRLRAMGGSFAGQDGVEPVPENLAIEVLDRLAVSQVSKSGAALDILTAEAKAPGGAQTLDMVVIDTLDVLVGGEAVASGSGSAQGNANLIAFMRRLHGIARSSTNPLAVFVITTIPSPAPTLAPSSRKPAAPDPPDPSGQPPPLSSLPFPYPLKPALSPTFSYLVDISILLVPAEPLFGPREGKDRYFVEVVKTRRAQAGGMIGFMLENGVRLEQLE